MKENHLKIARALERKGITLWEDLRFEKQKEKVEKEKRPGLREAP